MANDPATPATPAKKKKKSYIWWWVGGILILLLLMWVLIFRPFVFQKKSWLLTNGLGQFSATAYGKMTDAEIVTAYQVIEGYNNTIPATDTATTQAYAAMKTKYPAGS